MFVMVRGDGIGCEDGGHLKQRAAWGFPGRPNALIKSVREAVEIHSRKMNSPGKSWKGKE